MSNVFIEVKDVHGSFSKQNPEIHLISPYAALYKKLGEEDYDKVMMGMYLVYDPKSKLNSSGKRSEKDKQKDVSVNYHKNGKFSWSKYKKISASYLEDFRTDLEKKVDYLKQEIEERESYMKTLSWEADSTKKDKMLLNHDQYLKKYLEVKKEVDAERADISSRGGTTLSRTERLILDAEGR